jgi:hypothetical protein
MYGCPLCVRHEGGRVVVRLFSRAAVVAGALTAEDVPIAALFGRPLVLTCHACNSRLNFEVDRHAAARERPERIRVSADGHSVSATYYIGADGSNCLMLAPAKAQKPGALDGFQAALRSGQTFQVHGHFHQRGDALARISTLKSGLLTLFAKFGYQYALQRALVSVLEQIQTPSKDRISTFVIQVPGPTDWKLRRIIRVREPEWMQCLAVQMGPYVALLPLAGDETLYERIESHGRNEAHARGDALPWPNGPRFGDGSKENSPTHLMVAGG